MKIPKHNQKHRAGSVSLRGQMKQKTEAFYRLRDFAMRGAYLITDGCRRVLEKKKKKICLDMGNFIVTFYGQALRIESLAGKRLILAGQIASIVFKRKWEGHPHET